MDEAIKERIFKELGEILVRDQSGRTQEFLSDLVDGKVKINRQGGVNAGGSRVKLRKKKYSFLLAPDIASWLDTVSEDTQEQKTKIVEAALRQMMPVAIDEEDAENS